MASEPTTKIVDDVVKKLTELVEDSEPEAVVEADEKKEEDPEDNQELNRLIQANHSDKKLVKEFQKKYGISEADMEKLLEVANGLSERKQKLKAMTSDLRKSLTCGLSDKSDPDAKQEWTICQGKSPRRRAAKAGGKNEGTGASSSVDKSSTSSRGAAKASDKSEGATSSKGVDKGKGLGPLVLLTFAIVLERFRPNCKGKGKGKGKEEVITRTLDQEQIDNLLDLRTCIDFEPKSKPFETFYKNLRDEVLTPLVWAPPIKSYKELNLYEKIKAALFFLAIAKKEGFERYSELEQVLLNLLQIGSLQMAHVTGLENMQSSAHRLAHTLLNVICSTKKAENFTNGTMENLAKVKKFEIDTWWDTGSSSDSPYPTLPNEENFNLDLVATIRSELKHTIEYAELQVWGDW